MEELKYFLKVSVMKYVLRYEEKNGLEDLKKAEECLKQLIELEEKQNEKN